MTKSSISILLAETTPEIKSAITSVNVQGFEVETGFISGYAEFIKAQRNRMWDVLIVPIEHREYDLPKMLRSIHRKKLTTRIIAVGASAGREKTNELLELGIHQVLHQTDLKRFSLVLQQEIQTAVLLRRKKELEHDLNYKSQFIAKISHEMRTTLNSVILLSEILAENRTQNLNTEEIEYIDLIHSSSNNLLDLLNKILDLSKIQSGKMDIQLEEVQVTEFCKRIERLYIPVAKDKTLDFRFVDEVEENLLIKTDRIRLEQVLNNLISNAIKFTSQGYVQLKAYQPTAEEIRHQKLKEKQVIAFEIKDTGIGITDEKKQIIFESYVQAEGAATQKKYGGTGLGLAISKEISQILGGKMTLESTYGKGSSFVVYLPFDSSTAVMNKPEVEMVKIVPKTADLFEEEKRNKARKRSEGTVLLIDNSTIHNMALKEFLSTILEDCITAESAQEAYEVLQKHHHFDCIILDMYLPDAYGKDVLQKIREMEHHKTVPVIIYSGKTLSKTEQKELYKDAIGIVQKNVNSYKLLMGHILEIMENK
jgi:two-component system chemotaxis sensor kinase CheA